MRLIESSAPRRRARGGTLLSVVLHAAVIGAAAAATADAGIRDDSQPREQTIYFDAPPPVHTAPAPSTGASGPSTGAAAPVTPTIPVSAPTTIPVDLPPIGVAPSAPDPSAGLAETFTRGVGPTGSGTSGDVPSGDAYAAHLVERAATPLSTVRPRYPEPLRAAGVEGRASLRFVVDTAGRVEPASVRVTGATHPAFGDAARATVGAMRFRPAEVRGHPVRQLVELPFEFRLTP